MKIFILILLAFKGVTWASDCRACLDEGCLVNQNVSKSSQFCDSDSDSTSSHQVPNNTPQASAISVSTPPQSLTLDPLFRNYSQQTSKQTIYSLIISRQTCFVLGFCLVVLFASINIDQVNTHDDF